MNKNKIIINEMANANDPKDIVLATQRAYGLLLKHMISDIKEITTNPGLTWDQIEYVIDAASKKIPNIIVQESEQ